MTKAPQKTNRAEQAILSPYTQQEKARKGKKRKEKEKEQNRKCYAIQAISEKKGLG